MNTLDMDLWLSIVLHCWGGTQFCETLDYIWLSPEWHVDDVVDLPSRSELTVESFPSQDEPSDHMLIGATLSL